MTSRQKLVLSILIGLILAFGILGCGDDKKSTNPIPANPVLSANLDYTLYHLDLETGNIDTLTVGTTDTVPDVMDFSIQFNNNTAIHATAFQHQTLGRMIAHLPNRTFASVTASDTAGAPFTSSIVNTPFDTSRVILIKTDSANVYKLGNPVETATFGDGLTFDYQKLISGP